MITTTLRSLFLVIALAASASATSEENITRNLDAAPGGKLVVDVDFGSIDVTAGADDKVVLDAHREVDVHDQIREKEYMANAPITITREGNVVTVRARDAKSRGFNCSGHCSMDAKYRVQVPKKFETDLHTDGGGVSVSGLAGNTKAKTNGGELTFKNLEGPLVGRTSGGQIKVDDCRGPIDIETSGGDIRLTNGNGTLHAITSGGRIGVSNFTGDTQVRTSGGNLALDRITGKITGKTSGGSIAASIAGNVTGDVDLETSAGNIDLAVPAHAGLDITASTSVGKVISRLPLDVSEAGDEYLRGKLNGGGKSVNLETSAGNITLLPSGSELARR